MKPVEYYVYQFPQLTLVPKEGISTTDEYKNIALRGIFPEDLTFPMDISNEEELIKVDTPIGEVETIYLPIREVFERFAICLAYRCEPTLIPKTTGAMYISGINCWRKIYDHQTEFLKSHSEDEWDEEFNRFVSDKNNYKGIVLLISKGNYSYCDNEFVGFGKDEWLAISKNIRIYHEITHAICRKMFPDHVDAIRDEVLADSIGVYYALNRFDSLLIKKFLGTEGDTYRQGGRLQNYSEDVDKDMKYVNSLLVKLDDYFKTCGNLKPFDALLDIENKYIK
ncbi:MAG: hypothetical protein Q4E33_02935 [Erysipelotrichaceae bacterium]|nr:hypothetical protein [Erysipelotrichaceae bacterium]